MRLDWWTLALQTVNVLVLIWLLARFLFRPITVMIAQRRAATEALLADAAAAQARSEADARLIRQRLSDVAAEAERMLSEARATAQTEHAKLAGEAATEVSRARAEAEIAIGNERTAMEQALRSRACDLGVAVARRLLERLPARTVTAAMLEAVTAAVATLPESRRHDLSAAAGPIDVVTSVPLDSAQQAACRQALERVLGHAPSLTFRTDPTLIAGVELHTDRMLIRDNWKTDLERIAGELRRDEPHAA